MSKDRNEKALWIVIVVVLSVLVSCVMGAFAGGIAGYAVGRRAATREATFEVPRLPERPWEEREGALIVKIVSDSPADEAGLKVGDVIIAVDGDPLEGSLAEVIRKHKPGDVLTLTIRRGVRELDVDVQLGRHPEKDGAVPWLGIFFRQVPAPVGGGRRWRFFFNDLD